MRLFDRTLASDRGETLIELLTTVILMGIAVVAIVGGIGTSILMSDIHRKQATAGTNVRNYAEAIQSMLPSGGYVACATTGAYASPSGFSVPSGYTKSVVAGSMKYWNGSSWQTTCATDQGLQQLTVQVASVDGRASERVVVILRKPCQPPVDPTDPICSQAP
jgi:hypothetical protein